MNSKSLKANAFWNIFATIINMLLLFVLTPVITNGLGDVNYGAYVILSTIGGALTIIDLGLGEATLRYVAYYFGKNDYIGVNRVFSATLFLYTVLGFFVTFVFALFPHILISLLNLEALGNDGPLLIRLTLGLFLLTFISGCFGSIPQALQRFDIASYINIAQNVSRFILNIFVVYKGYGLKGLVVCNFILGAVFLLIQIVVSKKILSTLNLFVVPKLRDYKEIFGYGFFAFIRQTFGLIWQYCDNILLSVFLGPQFVGYFSIPMQIIGKIQGIVSSGTNVLFPRFAAEKDDALVNSLYIRSTQLALFTSMVIFVPFTLVVDDFLALWISESFASKAAIIAPILSFSYILRGAFLPYESLLKGLGYSKHIMFITIFSSLVILGLDVTFIPKFGLNGVGLAYVFSSLVGVVVIILIWKNIIKHPFSELFKLVFSPYLLSWVSLFLLYLLKTQIQLDLNFLTLIVKAFIFFLLNLIFMFLVYRKVDKEFVSIILANISKVLEKCHLRKV